MWHVVIGGGLLFLLPASATSYLSASSAGCPLNPLTLDDGLTTTTAAAHGTVLDDDKVHELTVVNAALSLSSSGDEDAWLIGDTDDVACDEGPRRS